MSFLGDALGNISNATGDVVSNLTGTGSDMTRNFTNLTWNAPKATQSTTAPHSTPTTPPAPTPTPANPYASEIDALNRQTAALQAQIAAQPKLIYRDTSAAWNAAQNSAASSVNPVYQDNLNREIQKQADALAAQQGTATANKAAADTTLAQTQQDIQTAGQRSQEDTANAIALNQQQEGNWQTQEGQQSDVAENNARLAAGDQGIMGRGAGALEQSTINRNATSDQQTQSFANDRDTKAMLNTRTLADLSTKGNRATELNTTQKADIERSLNDFITGQTDELGSFKASNEADRLSALYQATQQQYSTDTANWLASLSKSGARAQDIALASQVYGK